MRFSFWEHFIDNHALLSSILTYWSLVLQGEGVWGLVTSLMRAVCLWLHFFLELRKEPWQPGRITALLCVPICLASLLPGNLCLGLYSEHIPTLEHIHYLCKPPQCLQGILSRPTLMCNCCYARGLIQRFLQNMHENTLVAPDEVDAQVCCCICIHWTKSEKEIMMAIGRSLEKLLDCLRLFIDMGEWFSYSPTKSRAFVKVWYNNPVYIMQILQM